MHHTETRTVAASAEDVWRILADVERWPTWTRSMTSIELDGPFAVGATARVKQPRLPAVTWEVTELHPGRSFTWQNESVGLHSVGEHTVTAGPVSQNRLVRPHLKRYRVATRRHAIPQRRSG